MQKVRVAMIGAGGMANSVHYPSLASFDDVEIAAICDLDENRLNSTADKYKVERRYKNYRKMINDVAPDAVYVIGQPHIMYDIWTWCLQQKLNLYIEASMQLVQWSKNLPRRDALQGHLRRSRTRAQRLSIRGWGY